MRIEKVVKFVDNKNRNNKDNNKPSKRKSDPCNSKKNMTSKTDLVTEIQVCDFDTSTEIEDNDSVGWRSLPEIVSSSEDSDTCDTDKMEWLDDSFYQQAHMISNLEYAKL